VSVTVIDDFAAEAKQLENVLETLTETQWLAESAAKGWSVTDVVLHLAQSEEGVVASASGAGLLEEVEAAGTVDDWAARMVAAERAAPAEVFARWRRARDAAEKALRAADPQVPLQWVTGSLKPATLATTRLAEHWAHGLDITGPLGIDYPDTDRLRQIAWLAHRTLPYAFSLAGERPIPVRCSLTAPDGLTTWTFGPDDTELQISGPPACPKRSHAACARSYFCFLGTPGQRSPKTRATLGSAWPALRTITPTSSPRPRPSSAPGTSWYPRSPKRPAPADSLRRERHGQKSTAGFYGFTRCSLHQHADFALIA